MTEYSDDRGISQSDIIGNDGVFTEDGQHYLTALLKDRNGEGYEANRYRGWKLQTFIFDWANGRRAVQVVAMKDGQEIEEKTVVNTKPLRRFLPWTSVEIESNIEQNQRTAIAVLDAIDQREDHD